MHIGTFSAKVVNNRFRQMHLRKWSVVGYRRLELQITSQSQFF